MISSLSKIDVVTLAYQVVVIGLILHQGGDNDLDILFSLHMLILLLNVVIVLVNLETVIGQWLRWWYPIFFLPLFFTEMHYLVPAINANIYDLRLNEIDKILTQGSTVIDLPRTNFYFIAILQIGYLSYYFMPLLILWPLYRKKQFLKFEDAGAGILLLFYLSYLGYVLVPAIGPRYFLAHLETPLTDGYGIFLKINHALNFLENIQWDAFPSGHVAVAGGVTLYSIIYKQRFFAVPAVFFCLIVLSTVWLRYHYFIDIISGIVLIFVVFLIRFFISGQMKMDCQA